MRWFRKWRKARRKEIAFRQFNAAMEEIKIDRIRQILNGSTLRNERKNHEIAFYSTFCGPARAMSLSVPVHHINADFYFISNNMHCLKRAQKLGWIPFYLKVQIFDNAVISSHQAKISKALPHFFGFLQGYEKIFYLDDKIKFNEDILPDIKNYFGHRTYSLLVSYHRFLEKNIMFELAEAMGQSRYFLQRAQTVEFIIKKIHEGFQHQAQHMYETRLILRDLSHPEVNQINEEWYQAILECGIECQISFQFMAQKFTSIGGFDQKTLKLG